MATREQTNYEAGHDDLWRVCPVESYEIDGHQLFRMGGLHVIKSCRRKKSGEYYAKGYEALEANIQPAGYPKPKHDGQPLIVALGMGTDSIAMLVEMKNRGIRPDIVQWADTGSERVATYRYVRVIQAWLKRNDFPPLLIVRKRCPQAGHRGLAEQLWATMQLPSPAFHKNHSCSAKWKLEPQRDYHSFLPWLQSTVARTAIGFSAEETDRKIHGAVEFIGFSAEETDRRSYQIKDEEGYVTYYPLQEWGITRLDCIEIISNEGLPQPGKSACVFCPMAKLCEVKSYSDEAREFSFALEDRAEAGGKLNKIRGLRKGVNEKWSEWVERDPEEDNDRHFVGLVSDLDGDMGDEFADDFVDYYSKDSVTIGA